MLEVRCHRCDREGLVSLARLIEEHGADTGLPDLWEAFARDCRHARTTGVTAAPFTTRKGRGRSCRTRKPDNQSGAVADVQVAQKAPPLERGRVAYCTGTVGPPT